MRRRRSAAPVEIGAKTASARVQNRRNAVTAAAGVRLGVFALISVLVTGLLAAIMGNVGFGSSVEYRAVFASATSLEKGDDVRVAGVSVGEVSGVDHYERDKAMVSFRVKDEVPLTTGSRAEIRYLNLVGDRYLALEEGSTVLAEPLTDDDVIPMSQTVPALNLTELFNGFKPLFQALEPDQVNELSMNIVQVLQGEGGTIRGLLENTASLTNTLADRDQLIGEVVANLTQTLQTVDSRHEELNELVLNLKSWLSKLARDRGVIGGSLRSISDLTVEVASLLRDGRPLLKNDVAQLRDVAALLNDPKATKALTDTIDRLPELYKDQTRTGTYGSWYNYYVCTVDATFNLPGVDRIPALKALQEQLQSIKFHSTAARCSS